MNHIVNKKQWLFLVSAGVVEGLKRVSEEA